LGASKSIPTFQGKKQTGLYKQTNDDDGTSGGGAQLAAQLAAQATPTDGGGGAVGAAAHAAGGPAPTLTKPKVVTLDVYTAEAEVAASPAVPPALLAHHHPVSAVDLKDWLPDDVDRGRGAVCIAVKGLLSKEECTKLSVLGEAAGYSGDLEQASTLRQGKRAMLDNAEWADRIYARLSKVVPETWDTAKCSRGHVNTALCKSQAGRRLRRVGVNERFRFLKYGPGDYFRSHVDGCYVREQGDTRYDDCDRAIFTVQIYLNGGYTGGSTRFIDPRCKSAMKAGACPGVQCPEGLCKDPDVSAGDAVVFQHDLWHQGSELLAGQKETCRTEVMFRPEPRHAC